MDDSNEEREYLNRILEKLCSDVRQANLPKEPKPTLEVHADDE